MEPIKATLVGVRRYGWKLAEAVTQVPGLDIETCYHPARDTTIEYAGKLRCRPAFSVADAFAKTDAVIIATPDPSHLEYILSAIQAGIHVFVEKPMVASLEEARQLQMALKDFNGVFAVGHNMRREAAFRFIRKEFLERKLGELVTFQINLSHGGALNWNNEYWRTNPVLCREGPLRVNGVHASDVLEYLFGPIVSVYAAMDQRFSRHQAPDSGIAVIHLGRAVGTVHTNWVVPSISHFHFEFSNALVDFDLHRLNIRYGRDVGCVPTPTQETQLPVSLPRVEQFAEFAGAIAGRQEIETGFAEGFRALLFVEACYRSNKEKRPIYLDKIKL